MKYRILHTEWSDGWGGQERRIVSEMAGMRARGHRVWLATRPRCIIAGKAREAGIDVVELPFAGKADLRTILPLARLIRREAIDIVGTHSGIDSWVGAFAAKLGGAQLIRTRHLNIPLHRSWHNFVHFMADRIVTCGETMRNNLTNKCGFPAAQVTSIPTGIDFDRFRATHPRPETRSILGIDDKAFVVLMVGVIRAVKRHEVALRAFAQFSRLCPGATLLLAGDGPMQGDMEKLARDLELGESVRFLGHRDDVPDLLGAADCLLLTSRSEGIPQAVTQAMGAALPVVATAVGGVPELVIDGETGLLENAENIDGIAAALTRLYREPAFRERLGAAARRHVATRFSLDAMLDATEALYCAVLAEKTR